MVAETEPSICSHAYVQNEVKSMDQVDCKSFGVTEDFVIFREHVNTEVSVGLNIRPETRHRQPLLLLSVSEEMLIFSLGLRCCFHFVKRRVFIPFSRLLKLRMFWVFCTLKTLESRR